MILPRYGNCSRLIRSIAHSTGLAETTTKFLDGVRDGLYKYEHARPIEERIMRSGDMVVVYTVLDFQGGRVGRGMRR